MNDKLLIVDDDRDILNSLEYLLVDHGYDVRSSESGEDALRIFSAFNPDVVISDIQMPGMGGLELLKKSVRINSTVQFVFLTGYATIENVSDVMSHEGAFAYLQKPIVDFEMLYATICQAKEKQRLMAENLRWEQRLKHSNLIFERIFENMDAIVYVADIETYELIYANSKFKSTFGIKKDEKITGEKCWKVLQKDNDGPCAFCTNSKIVDIAGTPVGPYTWEFHNQILDRYFSIKDQAVYWHDGRVVKLETAMDVTQIKQYEIRTKKSEARFRKMAELLPVAICETDIHLNVTYMNRKGFELCGYTKKDFATGLRLLELVAPEEIQSAEKNLSDLISGNKKNLLTTRTIINKDGNKVVGLVNSSAIYNRKEHTGFMVTFLDMTHYNKLQKEVETANRFKAIGVLAGGIAHDLNNTLAAILGNINLAQIFSTDTESDEYFDAAEKGIMQAKSLANKLVGLSHIEAPMKSVICLSRIISDLQAQGGLFSQVNLTPPDKNNNFNIEVDTEQIKTVFSNLIVNASEAMDGKGTIEIYFKKKRQKHHSMEYVVTSISDTGVGISNSNIENVFDPYFTTKSHGEERGTGLGLSIAYSIVKKHGGFIEIHSEEGKGSRVDVYLPLARG